MIWPMLTRTELDINPFEVGQLHRAMNRLFEDFGSQAETFPALNVWSDENEAVVTAEVPGVDPKSIAVNVRDNLLTIEGERKPDELDEKDVYHRQERGYGRFVRSVQLPYAAENDAVKASYVRGVLKVVAPRRESSKPRRIAIESD